jgi:DNA polymerase III alpha subunit
MEVVLYTNEYQRFQETIKPDSVLFFEGMVDKSREEPSFKAKELYTLEGVQKKKTREILVQTSSMKLDEGTLTTVQKILTEHKGSTPVKIELADLAVQPAVRVQIQLGGGLNIQTAGLQTLRTLFGEAQVLAMGPNRKIKRTPAPAAEVPLMTPSDELG